MPSALLAQLLRGAAEVIREDELDRRLASGRALRVKLGIDPSRPDLHLGHAVVLRKLRQFQDLGHTAVLIIGDFTGRVGDPSGQSETRPFLDEREVEENARTYLDQAGLVLNLERAEVRRNSEWLARLAMGDVLRLAASSTVARMLERDDFQARYKEGRPISVAEFLYPPIQAMHSVAVRAVVEMGGADQKFNLLVGRDIQRQYGQEPQVVFTMPLLEGLEGERKMSKSYGNYVSLKDPPEEMFGKLMRIPDGLMGKYLLLCTDLEAEEARRIERGLADGSLRPEVEKRRIAGAIVRLYHGPEAAEWAAARFDAVHREHQVPEDVPELAVPRAAVREGTVWLPRLLTSLGLASSNSEARRLIEGGGVRIDGQVLTDPEAELEQARLEGAVLQVGRRRFARLTRAEPGPSPPAG